MSALGEFLHMGGYGLYVWGAYGLTALVMAWNAIAPQLHERALLRALAARRRDGGTP